MPFERIAILGTGLIGASVGLALRRSGFSGTVVGWDKDPAQLSIALEKGAVDVAAQSGLAAASQSDVVLLSGPVFSILDWMEQLAPVLKPGQLVTDVGSVKGVITERASTLYASESAAAFLPGHPMAGKEFSGAAHAEAGLFDGAVWLFTPISAMREHASLPEREWRQWVCRFGCRVLDLEAARHDHLCAWVSHLPQLVSTALSAVLEETFAADEDLRAIGGRALREMTRLGASPYSMWRDIASSNSDALTVALHALEQRLAHIRENLKTPELRAEFERANQFRLGSNADLAGEES
jgi:prephenate dehydrogenase